MNAIHGAHNRSDTILGGVSLARPNYRRNNPEEIMLWVEPCYRTKSSRRRSRMSLAEDGNGSKTRRDLTVPRREKEPEAKAHIDESTC